MKVILAVSFLTMIAAAISSFAIDILVRYSGASNTIMGILSAAPCLIYVASAIGLGANSDRVGHRRAILISSAISFVATIIYASLFYVGSFMVLIIVLLIIDLAEGVFSGWWWPVLQANLGSSAQKGNKKIRQYNFSWNLGLIAGNALMAVVTGISSDPAIIIPLLRDLTWGCLIIEGTIFVLLWTGFQRKEKLGGKSTPKDVAPECVVPPEKVPTNSRSPVIGIVGVSLLTVLVFTMNVGGILTNIFNQFTAYSENSYLILNLLPWIPIIDNARQFTQLGSTGLYKAQKSSVSQLTAIIMLMGLIVLPIAIASQELAYGGAFFIMALIGLHGLLSGMLYNATMQVMMQAAPKNRQGYYQGVYESVASLGGFFGPILASVVSEVDGYFASYSVLAYITLGCAFALIWVKEGVIISNLFKRSKVYMQELQIFYPRLNHSIIWLGNPEYWRPVPAASNAIIEGNELFFYTGNRIVEKDLWPTYAMRALKPDIARRPS